MNYKSNFILILASLLLGGCSEQPATVQPKPPIKLQAKNQADPKICLLFTHGSLGDKGFIDMQYTVMAQLQIEYGFELILLETQISEFSQSVKRVIDLDCNVIVGTEGYVSKQWMLEFAPQYPQHTFILMDEVVTDALPNLANSYFITAEAAYLAGVLAADMSKTKAIGVIGGTAAPTVDDFIVGFTQGVKDNNPDIEIITQYIDKTDPDNIPWLNSKTAAQLTEKLHQQHNIDIVFAVAGGSNWGAFIKAKELGLYAIGVDVDQDSLIKGVILTSVIKKVDIALRQLVLDYLNGNFISGSHAFTLADDGVGISEMTYSKNQIPKATLEKLTQTRQAIIDGKIKVDSVWRQLNSKVQ